MTFCACGASTLPHVKRFTFFFSFFFCCGAFRAPGICHRFHQLKPKHIDESAPVSQTGSLAESAAAWQRCRAHRIQTQRLLQHTRVHAASGAPHAGVHGTESIWIVGFFFFSSQALHQFPLRLTKEPAISSTRRNQTAHLKSTIQRTPLFEGLP